MLKYIIKRLLSSIPILLIITIITFLLIRLAPGDPTKMFISPRTRPEDRELIRKNLGLDKPLHIQYGIWLKNLITKGDLGYSLINGRPVLESILERIPATIILMGSAYILSLILAVPLGIFSAVRQYSLFDYIFTIFSFVGLSLPPFWLALMVIYYLSLKFPLFPPMGMTYLIEGDFKERVVDLLWHLFLPMMVIAARNLATWSRFIRSSLLEVMGEDYIRTAYSKGLSEFQVIYSHALKNSLLPLITIIGLSLPDILAGTFIIEYIFAWPGMGRLGMEAVFHRDYTILMGDIFISSVLVIIANIMADVSYAIVDPRIRLERKE